MNSPDKLGESLGIQHELLKVVEKMLKSQEERQKWHWSLYNVWVVFRAAGYIIFTGYCANFLAGRHGVYLDRDKCICTS